MLSFLNRFKERLGEEGFPPNGEAPSVVAKALDEGNGRRLSEERP